MGKCVVPGCNVSGHHTLPKDINRRDLWMKAMKLDGQILKPKHPKVCTLHFRDSDYMDADITPLNMQRRNLKRHAVPSIFPWSEAPPTETSTFISEQEIIHSIMDSESPRANIRTRDPLLKSADDLGIHMMMVVHLDLKGAPWKISYLERVLISAKQWGATGVLIEWEDTFPYSGELMCVGSQNGVKGSGGDGMYSVEEVQHILRFAKDIGMEAIQLVQTISHLEFVLKHPAYRELREMCRSPAVLCPSHPESRKLVKDLVTQILEAQPDANYIHIGADEVWHAGICQECKTRAESSVLKNAVLFLQHIKELVSYIKQLRPNITVLMWDDMLRGISSVVLKEYKLGELVEPVLWHYNPKECFRIDTKLWDSYRQVFPRTWAGSAFKGANGSCQIISPVSRYVSNHEAWVDEIMKYRDSIDYAGVILTGWSRYDHFATLCELLPVSLPSLASCLRTLTRNAGCQDNTIVDDSLPSEEWPGEALVRQIHNFVMLRERCHNHIHSDLVSTWLNPWQLENNYTNPIQIEGIAMASHNLLRELTTMQDVLKSQLLELTGPRSTEEWIQSLVAPLCRKMAEIRDVAGARACADAGIIP